MGRMLRSMVGTMAVLCLGITYAQSAQPPAPRPSGFIANQGQWPGHVLFAARTPTVDVYVTTTGMTFDKVRSSGGQRSIAMTWHEGRTASGAAFGNVVGTVTFFRGKQRVVATMTDRVTVRDVYRGVDVIYSLDDQRLRFDLDVDAGADISLIGLQWNGSMSASQIGSQRMEIENCLVFDKLQVLQEGVTLPSRFDVSSVSGQSTALRFAIVGNDPAKPLVIDPVVYGAYVGSSGDANDVVTGMEYQKNGEVLVAGHTQGMEFPGAGTGYSPAKGGSTDGFIARMDAKLQRVYSYAIIGGTSDDRIKAICTDHQNGIYAVGETSSADFPTTAGASSQLYKAGMDGFLVKLDSTLTSLKLGTYHGGNKDDTPRGVVVDKNLVIYMAGTTFSNTNFPVTFPVTVTRVDRRGRHYTEPGGGANLGQTEGFVASYSQAGTMLQSRFFGRSGHDIITAIAVDNASGVYLTGSTTSADFETAPTADRFASGRLPYDRTYNGGLTDAFVVKLNNELALAKTDDGTYSTYLGGNGDEEGRAIYVDDLGRAQVVGVTTSTNLEAVGTQQTSALGLQDIFMAVLADDGRDLNSLTYYGSAGMDDVLGAKPYVLPTTAIIYGYTSSTEFPISGIGSNSERAGSTDGFIALINTATNRYCTLITGSGNDTVRAVALDPKGDILFAASTTSSDLVTHDSSYQGALQDQSIYLGKLAFGTMDLSSPRGGESYCIGSNVSVTWTTLEMLNDDKYSVELSTDNGSTWSTIASGITTKSYSWKPTALQPGSTYQIAIRSERGHRSKTPGSFVLNLPPAITRQPVATSACEGQTATLSVEARGGGLRYQWRHNGSAINGATQPTYTVTIGASTIGTYECIVAGQCQPSITSSVVNVSRATPTAISKQPTGLTVEKGKAFELSVEATGGDLSYQWQKDGADISGATSATYAVTSANDGDGGSYRCVVTGGCGSVTTDAAVVNVEPVSSVQDGESTALSIRVLGPQPASDVVHVSLPTVGDVVEIRIRDLQGRAVAAYRTPAAPTLDIPVRDLSVGTYLLEVVSNARVARVSIVIAR
jgi:hypothetical protein